MNVQQVYRQKMDTTNTSIENFLWSSKYKYAGWLAQTYFYTAHSTNLLRFASDHLKEKSFLELKERFLEHIEEENNHEVLAELDLKRLGFTLANFSENGFTRSLYETQYYKIKNIHPCTLLGYILALEGIAVDAMGAPYSTLKKNFARQEINFLRVHVEEDPDHLVKALEQIDNLPQSFKIEIMKNFDQTCDLYVGMLDRILRENPCLTENAENRNPYLLQQESL